MGKKIGGHPSTPPVQPPSVGKRDKISSELTKTKEDASKFVITGRGKSSLGSGTPPSYSGSPTRDSKRVAKTAADVILPGKKAKKGS